MTPSKAVLSYRAINRLTQLEFCALLKAANIPINRTTLGSIEKPDKIAKVTFGTVEKVCNFIGVNTIEFEDVTDSKK